MEDPRGVLRGSCKVCDCSSYKWSVESPSVKCEACHHPPGLHDRVHSQSRKSPAIKKTSKHDLSEKSPFTTRRSKGDSVSEIPDTSSAGTVARRNTEPTAMPTFSSVHTSYGFEQIQKDYRHQKTANLQSIPATYGRPPSQGIPATFGGPPRVSMADPSTSNNFSRPVELTDLDGTGFEQNSTQTVEESESGFVRPLPAWLSSQEAISPDLLCIGCHTRQKYPKGDGTYHDYCGRTCREKHEGNNTEEFGAYPRCVACGRACKYKRRDGTYHDYCGMSCRDAHLSKSNMMLPAGVDGVTISSVSISRYGGSECRALFQKKWAPQKGMCPSVELVFLITNSLLQQQFDIYKRNLGVLAVEQHFHGTSLKCDLARNNALCSDRSCGVCGISRFGFNSNLIGTNVSFQRFGHGFYLAPHSSKCHDYTQGCEVSGCRALLLCEVCPGKKHRIKRNNQSLRAPPVGCDCVYGDTGQDLNYPEIVLYDCGAILPKYIILYKKDEIRKLVV